MARDIQAGKAFLRVSIREDLAGLRRTSKKLKAWGANIAKVGGALSGVSAAVLGPLAGMSKAFADAGDQIHKMSMRTGVGAQALSELGHAAELSGTDLDAVGSAMQRMNRRIGRMTTGQGTSTQVEAMEELGLSLGELEGMNPEQQFMALADAMNNYGNDAQAAGLAQRAFGTEVDRILPMLADGSKGIEAMRQEARDLGITLTDEDADSAAELTDAMARVTSSMKAAALQAGAALAPMLTDLAGRFTDVVGCVVDFVKENRQLVVMAAKVAAVIGGVGAAIMGVGGILAMMGTAIGGIVSAFGAVASVLGVVLSPLGLIVAGLAGATAAFVKFTDTGKSLKSDLMSTFGDLAKTIGEDLGGAWQTVKDTFGGVVDALKSGDMEAAGDIAMTGLKLAFMQATKEIRSLWIKLNKFLTETLISAAKSMIGTIQKVATKINEAWGGFKLQQQVKTKEQALAELEKRRDDMSRREYLVAKADIQERGAAARLDIIKETDKRTGKIDSTLESWTANVDDFGDAMQDSLDADLEEQKAAIAKAKAEFNRQLAERGAEAAADRMKERMDGVVDRMKDASDEADETTKAAMAGTSTGTFSAAAARVMFAGQPTSEEKQIAKNTEEMASTLRGMERRRCGGAVYE